MKIFLFLMKYNIFFYFLLISFTIPSIKCEISLYELINYINSITIDRFRQIYWNILEDLQKRGNITNIKSVVEEDNIFSIDRKDILDNVHNYSEFLNLYYSNEGIADFKEKMQKIDLFNITNIDYLFSDKLPRNFLINFAINIDKYERIRTHKISGISDYINYLTNDRIIEYLKQKYSEYKNEIEADFDKIVLNNIDINYDNVVNYYKSKKNGELIHIILGIENYYFSELNKYKDSFYRYEHENLINIPENDLYQLIALYNKELDLDNIDDFMYKIEYRNFKYISIKDFFDNDDDSLGEKLIVLEKYYKRQTKEKKSLRRLNDYIKNIDPDNQKKILTWGLSKYPELFIDGIFDDISSSEISLKYGEIKEFIKITQRNHLLKYVYNIHTYENKIKSIYDENLFNLYRYKSDFLYEVILSDTNNNRELQSNNTFMEFADLKKDNFIEYLKHLERSQLKKILPISTEIYYINKPYISPFQVIPEKQKKREVMEYFDKTKFISDIESNIKGPSSNIPSTSEFFETAKVLQKNPSSDYIGYYNNIHDFLRSTNILYLKRWLRKIENHYRNTFSIEDIQGGMRFNYMNDLSKKDILELFDVYISKFPEYFEPNNFIINFGLDDDITPHKLLINLFYEENQKNNKQIIMKIAYSLTGYFQRKNIQANFDVENFLKELNNSISNGNHLHSFVFQFFRLINIFPELNNKKIFEIMCINNNTRIININEENHLETFFKRNKLKLAKNIQYYLNNTSQYDKINLDGYTEEQLQKYILEFLNSYKYLHENELKSQILDGYFPFIIYDYNKNYLNSLTDSHIDFIFKNIKNMCSQNYPCNSASNATNREEKLMEILHDLKYVQEFQKPEFFDKNFDFIENKQKDNFTEILVNSTVKNLRLYSIMCFIIKLENCENKSDKDCEKIYSDTPYQLFYMSKNEMIRYILKERENNKNKINEKMLPILVDYYKLELGSENIHDLTLY